MNQLPMDELSKKLEERTSDLEQTRANLAAAEAALRESESKNQAMLAQSPDMVFVSRIDDFRFTEVNDRACEHYGYSREEFLALEIFDLEIDPPLREHITSLYDSTPVGREIEVYGTNRRKDGTTFPVHVRFAKLNDVLAIANVRDISERDQERQELRRLATIVESVNDPIIAIDPEMRITVWNGAAEKLFGYTPEEALGETVELITPPHTLPQYLARVPMMFGGQRVANYDTQKMTKSGRIVDVSTSGSPIFDQFGEVVGAVGINRDLTDQKRAERALKESEERSNARLLEEKARAEEIQARKTQQLQTIFEIAETLAGPADFQTKADSVSSIIQERLEADAVVLRTLDEAAGNLNLVAASGTESIGQTLSLDQEGPAQRAFRQEKNIVIADHTQLSYHQMPKAKSWGLESFCAIPLHSSDGISGTLVVASRRSDHFNEERVELLEAISVGISALFESARLSENLEQSRRKMAEQSRLASVGELAAGVAHEINNPLTAILMGSELISESDLPKDTLVQLNAVADAARRAAAIVRGLLLFARQEAPQPEPLGLDSIIDQVLGLKKHDFAMHNIQSVCEFEPELPNCLVDNNQISQVIVNILNNAEDALITHKGGGEITIKIDSTPDAVTLEIRDDGPGIEPKMLHKIFEPFYTTKGPGTGTGLGLSICHGIVMQHGGEMWATSEKGSGTSFFVRLPVTDAVGVSQLALQNQSKGSTAAMGRLLVVDDEPEIRHLLAKGLDDDFEVIDEAKDGETALDMIQAAEYDCILLDLKMPGISGMEVFERTVETDHRIADRIIIMTGDTASAETASFLSNMMNRVLHKPFTLDDVKDRISELLQVGKA